MRHKKTIVLVGTIVAVALSVTTLFTLNTSTASSINNYPAFFKDKPRDSVLDSWGQGNRQCTSWAAWKLYETYGYHATNWFAAYQWPENATKAAIRTTTEPLVHSVAIDDSFVPGHAMWVERINDDGTIHVSEYNYKPGEYSERDIDPTGLTFIDVAGSRL